MPKGKKYPTGGKLNGASHEEGGIPIEAEGGEFIIKNDSVNEETLPMLEHINETGEFPTANAMERSQVSPMGDEVGTGMYKEGGEVYKDMYEKGKKSGRTKEKSRHVALATSRAMRGDARSDILEVVKAIKRTQPKKKKKK